MINKVYLKIPELPRKYVRDFGVIFLTLVATSGVFWQDTPNWHTLARVLTACFGLAVWRFGRDLLTPYLNK